MVNIIFKGSRLISFSGRRELEFKGDINIESNLQIRTLERMPESKDILKIEYIFEVKYANLGDVVIEGFIFVNSDPKSLKTQDTLSWINLMVDFEMRDKSGVFVGARMGRPEKAKMRKLKGNPHVLFPVGDEGGRMRSVQSALEKGRITGDFPMYKCGHCGKEDVVSLGQKLGVDLGNTFSCYVDDKKHCGVCLACRIRQEAFYWANITDRTDYKEKMKDFRLA